MGEYKIYTQDIHYIYTITPELMNKSVLVFET